MARASQTGPFIGNYVTFRLLARQATGIGETQNVVDSITMPMDFRVSAVCFDGLGLTNNVNADVTASGGTNLATITNLDGSAPQQVLPAALGGIVAGVDPRNIPSGTVLNLRITTDGTGLAPAGSVSAWVTGYFNGGAQGHITNQFQWREEGQAATVGPAAGYYDMLTLTNLRQSANQAERTECTLLAPYAGRVEAITYDIRDHTETTGTIVVHSRHVGDILHTNLDIDVNEQFVVNAASTPALIDTAGRRTFAQSAAFALQLATGLNDVVPIGRLSAHILVWVQGHVSAAGGDED